MITVYKKNGTFLPIYVIYFLKFKTVIFWSHWNLLWFGKYGSFLLNVFFSTAYKENISSSIHG